MTRRVDVAGPPAPGPVRPEPVASAPAGVATAEPAASSPPPRVDAFSPPVAGDSTSKKPVSLGLFGGQAVGVDAQGRLVLASDQGTLQDVLRAHRAALQKDQPFASLRSRLVLQDVANRLEQLHRAGLLDAKDDKHLLDQRQLRATSLALLERAAVRAGQLGDPALQRALLGQLTRAIAAEPHRPLRDFSWESLVARADRGALPMVPEAKNAVYPSRPPYEAMLADGVLRIAYYIDNDGSPILSQREFLRSLDLKETHVDSATYQYTKEATATSPKIEITLRAPRSNETQPSLFEKIDEPGVDLIAYSGHAGYGHRVEAAISQGSKGTGAGKLLLLMQCGGDISVESLARAFPDAHVISTRQPSDDPKDQALFREVLNGFSTKASYEQLEKNVLGKIRPMKWKQGTAAESHYFYPTSRAVVGAQVDRDRDGVKDGGAGKEPPDHLFNVVYPKRLDAAGGFNPVVQPLDLDALDGAAFTQAVGALTLLMRYNQPLAPSALAELQWGTIRAGGFFQPPAGDEHAFRFSRLPDGAVRVEASARYAHTEAKDLSLLLAYEAGLYFGKQAKLDATGTAALALALTAQAAHQQSGWRVAKSAFDEPWLTEALFAQRHGLGPLGFGDVADALGPLDNDELRPANVEALRKVLATKPELVQPDRHPTVVGQTLAVPDGVRLGSEALDAKTLQRVVDALGVKGVVQEVAPKSFEVGKPTMFTVSVKEPSGALRLVGLSVDADSVVRAASRVDADWAATKRRVGRSYLREVAVALKRDPSPWLRDFDDLTRQAQSPARAVATILERERKNVELGVALPAPERFEALLRFGFGSAEESAPVVSELRRMYPSGRAQTAERAVLTWFDGAAGLNNEVVRRKYREVLAETGARDGAGRAVLAALAALPAGQNLPKFPLQEVLTTGLMEDGVAAEVVAALSARMKWSPSQLTGELLAAWSLPEASSSAAVVARAREMAAANAPPADMVREAVMLAKTKKSTLPYNVALLEKLHVLKPDEARALKGLL